MPMSATETEGEKAEIVYIPRGVVLCVNAYTLPEGLELVPAGIHPQSRSQGTSPEADRDQQR